MAIHDWNNMPRIGLCSIGYNGSIHHFRVHVIAYLSLYLSESMYLSLPLCPPCVAMSLYVPMPRYVSLNVSLSVSPSLSMLVSVSMFGSRCISLYVVAYVYISLFVVVYAGLSPSLYA